MDGGGVHHKAVVGGAAGILPGGDDKRAGVGEFSLTALQRLLGELRGREVAIHRFGSDDAEGFDICLEFVHVILAPFGCFTLLFRGRHRAALRPVLRRCFRSFRQEPHSSPFFFYYILLSPKNAMLICKFLPVFLPSVFRGRCGPSRHAASGCLFPRGQGALPLSMPRFLRFPLPAEGKTIPAKGRKRGVRGERRLSR